MRSISIKVDRCANGFTISWYNECGDMMAQMLGVGNRGSVVAKNYNEVLRETAKLLHSFQGEIYENPLYDAKTVEQLFSAWGWELDPKGIPRPQTMEVGRWYSHPVRGMYKTETEGTLMIPGSTRLNDELNEAAEQSHQDKAELRLSEEGEGWGIKRMAMRLWDRITGKMQDR